MHYEFRRKTSNTEPDGDREFVWKCSTLREARAFYKEVGVDPAVYVVRITKKGERRVWPRSPLEHLAECAE